jgi:hypothetical protein
MKTRFYYKEQRTNYRERECPPPHAHKFKKSKDKWVTVFQKTNLLKYCFGTDHFKVLI